MFSPWVKRVNQDFLIINLFGLVFCKWQVKLILQQKKKASGGYFDYIATMCGVIGGVITVLG